MKTSESDVVELVALQNQIKASKERESRIKEIISRINNRSDSIVSLYPCVKNLQHCEEKLRLFESSPLMRYFPFVLKLIPPLKSSYDRLISEFENSKDQYLRNSSGVLEGSFCAYDRKLKIALVQKSRFVQMLECSITQEKQLRKKLLDEYEFIRAGILKDGANLPVETAFVTKYWTIEQLLDLNLLLKNLNKKSINVDEVNQLVLLYSKELEEEKKKLDKLNRKAIRLAKLEELIIKYKTYWSRYNELKISQSLTISEKGELAKIVRELKNIKSKLLKDKIAKFEQFETQRIENVSAIEDSKKAISRLSIDLKRLENVKRGLSSEKVLNRLRGIGSDLNWTLQSTNVDTASSRAI